MDREEHADQGFPDARCERQGPGSRRRCDAGHTTRSRIRQGSFDTTLDARRSFVADTGENRTEDKPEDVAVSGAERGVLFRNTTSFGDTRFDEFDLAILLKDGSKIFFSGVVPSGGDVEADAILESFRLAGG